MDSENTKFMEAWLEAGHMDRISDYVRRGRRFATIELVDLKASWITSLRNFIGDPRLHDRRDSDDAGAELALRGEEPPFEELADEANTAVEAMVKDLEADPERYQEVSEQLMTDIGDFVEGLDKTRRN